jgi:tetratricopeptide (TPR) repeat protein
VPGSPRKPQKPTGKRPSRAFGKGGGKSGGKGGGKFGKASTKRKSIAAPRKKTAQLHEMGRDDRKKKRTSKNSDERNPTRSGVDYPSPKFRARDEELETPVEKQRPALRKVQGKPKPAPSGRTRKPAKKAPRRRNVKSTEASAELAKLAGRNAKGAQLQLARAADAFRSGREREAMKLLRPLRESYPDASAVRELLGLCHYRIGQYAAAAKELEAFVELTDSVEQHPVLMDCYRAMGKYNKVDELWDELALASPSSALVTEGRIVLAGARADRGRIRDAISLLERRGSPPKRVQDHHLRLWYALADLYERAGEIPKARDLFLKVRRQDASFADVAERLASLG